MKSPHFHAAMLPCPAGLPAAIFSRGRLYHFPTAADAGRMLARYRRADVRAYVVGVPL